MTFMTLYGIGQKSDTLLNYVYKMS